MRDKLRNKVSKFRQELEKEIISEMKSKLEGTQEHIHITGNTSTNENEKVAVLKNQKEIKKSKKTGEGITNIVDKEYSTHL